MDCLFRQLLSEHALDHVLLAGDSVADTDQDATRDVAREREAQDNSRECERPDVVGDRPRTRSQSNLQ